MSAEYMRGRADERAAVVEWLRAEVAEEDDQHSTWSAALTWAASALENIHAESEPAGTRVHPHPSGEEVHRTVALPHLKHVPH